MSRAGRVDYDEESWCGFCGCKVKPNEVRYNAKMQTFHWKCGRQLRKIPHNKVKNS
jgi:hypothetical protein